MSDVALPDDEVLVFRVALVPGAWARFLPRGYLDLLRARLPTEAGRREAISCDGALRLILGRLLDREPRELTIARGPRGKPYLAGGPGFSLTHAHNLGLIAVARRAQVGVDLEPADHAVDVEAVAEGFFPETERREILAAPPADQLRVLLHAFTRFESAVKATGDGLTVPADDFPTLVGRMLWQHVDVGEGFIACVTADGPPWTVRVLDATSLL